MKKAVNYIYVLFVTLSLSLIMADCGLLDTAFSHNHYSSQRACADLVDHFEHAHSGYFEDEVFTNDFLRKYNNTPKNTCIFSLFDLTVNNSFTSSVWQPPKLS